MRYVMSDGHGQGKSFAVGGGGIYDEVCSVRQTWKGMVPCSWRGGDMMKYVVSDKVIIEMEGPFFGGGHDEVHSVRQGHGKGRSLDGGGDMRYVE